MLTSSGHSRKTQKTLLEYAFTRENAQIQNVDCSAMIASHHFEHKNSHRIQVNQIKCFQTYLHLGQHNFGPHACDICGMLYSVGVHEDEFAHKQFHREHVKTLHSTGRFEHLLKREIIQGFIQLSPTRESASPSLYVVGRLHNKCGARTILKLQDFVNAKLGLVDDWISSVPRLECYVATTSKQIVGVAFLQSIRYAYKVQENAMGLLAFEKARGPLFQATLGFRGVWICPEHRERGKVLASLFHAARKNTVTEEEIIPQLCAFHAEAANDEILGRGRAQACYESTSRGFGCAILAYTDSLEN